MSPAARVRRLPLILLIAACAIWYLYYDVLSVIPTPAPSDFGNIYDAARFIAHGQSPFLTPYYIYPPLLACVVAPIARFSYFTARWIWFGLAQACLLGAAWLWWRRLGRDWVAAAAVAFVWGVGMVAHDGFATGQPDQLLTLLIVVACVGSGWIGGAAVGAGFAVKLLPAPLGLLAPLERNWRGFVACVTSAAFFIAAPWVILAFLRGPLHPANADFLRGTPCVLSWSLPSVVLRVMEPPGPGGKIPTDWLDGWDLPRLHLSRGQKLASVTVAAGTMATGIILLLFKTRARLRAEDVPIAGTALMALTLAASPIAWWHYQAMQYPGVALLFCCAIRGRNWIRLIAAFSSAAFLFPLPALVLRYYYGLHNRWPEAPGLIYFWTSVTPVASLCLFGLLLSYIPRNTPGGANWQTVP